MKPIYIISGLPRSGTSMLMQALHAGGLPVAEDGIRKPDESNPKGYLEIESIKTSSETILSLCSILRRKSSKSLPLAFNTSLEGITKLFIWTGILRRFWTPWRK